jgi:hypothetical protein
MYKAQKSILVMHNHKSLISQLLIISHNFNMFLICTHLLYLNIFPKDRLLVLPKYDNFDIFTSCTNKKRYLNSINIKL